MTKSQSPKRKKRGATGNRPQRAHSRHKDRRSPSGASPNSSSGFWLYGIHAVAAALQNQNRKIRRLLATNEALEKLSASGQGRMPIEHAETTTRAEIDQIIGPDKTHQGAAILTDPLPSTDLVEVLRGLADAETPSLLLALDQVTDPHNVGAVMRSAAAFGADAMITTRHNAPNETGVMAKAASGALETLPFVHVTNLKRALKTCQDAGYWTVGLDAKAETTLAAQDLPQKCVLVFGSEGEGLRTGVAQECDFMARLPIEDGVESLNISNAAAISMYEWRRQHS